MPKSISITISDRLYKNLLYKKRKEGYLTIKELISDVLRKSIPKKKTIKLEFEDYFSKHTRLSRKIEGK